MEVLSLHFNLPRRGEETGKPYGAGRSPLREGPSERARFMSLNEEVILALTSSRSVVSRFYSGRMVGAALAAEVPTTTPWNFRPWLFSVE